MSATGSPSKKICLLFVRKTNNLGANRLKVLYCKLKAVRSLFNEVLRPHKPDTPFTGTLVLTAAWYFYTRSHKEGVYRTTRPDTDNLEKLLKDCMTAVGFWRDDVQVCVENVIKCWAHKKPGSFIIMERLDDGI